MYEQILKFIMGGILIITLDYFAKKRNSKVCAFIPAVPVISLIGLYFICAHNGNIKEYVYNLVLYLSISVMFYLLFYILLHYNIRIYIILPVIITLYMVSIILSIY
jgi:uncharacterized membrane protein (GlpM family)